LTNNHRWLFAHRWTLAAVCGVTLVFGMLPTVIVGILGGFMPRERFFSVSPDGRYRVSVTVRAEFPANEFLDPAIVVGVTLSETESGKTLDYMTVGLWEVSDFGQPEATWETSGIVAITNLDDKHGLALRMNVAQWRASLKGLGGQEMSL
jgi:hypothetical protein